MGQSIDPSAPTPPPKTPQSARLATHHTASHPLSADASLPAAAGVLGHVSPHGHESPNSHHHSHPSHEHTHSDHDHGHKHGHSHGSSVNFHNQLGHPPEEQYPRNPTSPTRAARLPLLLHKSPPRHAHASSSAPATAHPHHPPATEAQGAHGHAHGAVQTEESGGGGRKPLSYKLIYALRNKPTLSRTWEKQSFVEEQKSAPLLERGRDGRSTAYSRPTSLYASPAAIAAFRLLPVQSAPSSPTRSHMV